MARTVAEHAERVLLGTTLDDKLRGWDGAPGQADVHAGPLPGALSALPAVPGRPPELRIDGPRQRVRFPRLGATSDERAHGEALHFFANHELLAVELMALFLLRFPEAPPALRRAVLHTLAEEQTHLALYLRRMAAMGVTFGSLPVSRFFWDCLAQMSRPEQYLATLALTFEQANLDHSRRFEALFARAGDDDSAALMRRIHADEIGHVRLGVRWLDRLAAPGDERPRFARYREALVWPLTPAWAKGEELDREARRAAGLDDEFIDALEAYTRSRGRPPRVHLFNPFAEAVFAAAPRPYRPPERLQRFADDLALLPAFVAAQDDVVVLPAPPRAAHLAALRRAGLETPQLWARPIAELAQSDDGEAFVHIGGLRPWAWSPEAVAALAPLRSLDLEPERAGPDAEVFSKAWAAELAGRWLRASEHPWMAPAEAAGAVLTTVDAVEAHVGRSLAAGAPVLVKAPWSTAGRDRVRYLGADDLASGRRWLERTLARHGAAVVQPWLRRVLDFSVLLTVQTDGAVLIEGLTRFATDDRGQYLGTVLGPSLAGLSPALVRFVAGEGGGRWRLAEALDAVARFVGGELAARGHRGPAGVDAMVYADEGGALRLHPLVEVNPRCTMGHVALALDDRVTRKAGGWFRIVTAQAARSQGFAAFSEWAQAQPPPRFDDRGRLCEGVLPLTDPAVAQAAVAFLAAGEAGTAFAKVDDLDAKSYIDDMRSAPAETA
jgi:uncharacterized ferritin-like protein (DUF455 family)